MTTTERQFLYMPMMHAEDRAVQQRSLHYFATLGDDFIFGFAKDHADVIARFGRFPSRNAALGRVSTPEERSEEHTSELQSLMRISYAVFCLKKKKTQLRHARSQSHDSK